MNKKIKDLTGKVFGKLKVICIDEERSNRKTYWMCQCECGRLISVRSDALQTNQTSCGCGKHERLKGNTYQRTHNMSKTRLYKMWQGIKKRTGQIKANSHYKTYFEKNIKMCDEWNKSFETFYEWAINNGYKEDLTIDRIDNNGNYEPNNCKWSTAEEQANNRDTNINIRIGNITKTLTEWCKLFDLDYKRVLCRYHRYEENSLDYLFQPYLYANTEITD